MALVQLPFEQVAVELSQTSDAFAAVRSSPSSCVVSGTAKAVEGYLQSLDDRGVHFSKVKADVAFHSPLLQNLVAPLRDALAYDLNPRPPNIPIYSTSHSDPRTSTRRGAKYWTHNMMNPVWLVDAVEAAVKDGFQIFLEVSSHPIVSHSIEETLEAQPIAEAAAFGVMTRGGSAEKSTAHAVARLHTLGARVDFHAQTGTGPWSTAVPNTPWVHKPFWKSTSYTPTQQQHVPAKHTLLGRVIPVADTDIKVWATSFNDTTKPYPLEHSLSGTEIIPAAVYCNTFRAATGATILKGLELRIPMPVTGHQREVQIIVRRERVATLSRMTPSNEISGTTNAEHAWIEHSATEYHTSNVAIGRQCYSLPDIKKRIGFQHTSDYIRKHLQGIGVSSIAFPWEVLEHFGNDREMLVMVDMDPSSQSVSWSEESWAPFLDAATSVGASIFVDQRQMRIVSGMEEIQFFTQEAPPKRGYLFVEKHCNPDVLEVDISVLRDDGLLLVKVQGMKLSDLEVNGQTSKGADSLVHRVAWVPPTFSETPMPVSNAVIISPDSRLSEGFTNALKPIVGKVVSVSSCEALGKPETMSMLQEKESVLIYAPETFSDMNDVAKKAHEFVWEISSILTMLTTKRISPKVYVVTDSAYKGRSPAALAQYSLYGFARVAGSEYPDLWGGLIDSEGRGFPLLSLRYVQGQSVVRIQDGLPRVARIRPFGDDQRSVTHKTFLPQPHGTYLVTGGFGDLGLRVLRFLAEKGARRIIIVSRRKLPPRRDWLSTSGTMGAVVQHIGMLEAIGVTTHTIALDIGSPSAVSELLAAIDLLSLPPVLGVVHAAGISGYGFIKDNTSKSLSNVMCPKVHGALNLHCAFPPGTLDFFVFFSSIGQIIGTPGQSGYASSNAFLDILATHRRSEGCNSISFQWTAWRGLGLASDTALVDLELRSKGVTDITVEEAFRAWSYLSNIDTDHAVVTRTRVLDADEPLPCSLITDVVQRRIRHAHSSSSSPASPLEESKTVPEVKLDIRLKVNGCIASVLHMSVEDIGERAAFADLGVDSLMTTALRQQLQKAIGVEVPATITWSHPTVTDLVEWLYSQTDGRR
jgi:6-methylsalicylic acid synthase